MNRRICILADIRAIQTHAGILEVFKIDSDGYEKGSPVATESVESNVVDRWYRCNNCGNEARAPNGFAMKEHLGRFHEVIDPFNIEEK